MTEPYHHVTLNNGIKYTVDGFLAINLERAKQAVKKDWDMFFIIDGLEGSGKSTLGQQCAGYLDRDFNIDQIAFTPEEFIKAIEKAKKYQSILFDEAMSGLHSRASMTAINRSIVQMAAEMRQKNLFVFIILPTFFDLDRYIALWRSRALLHVYADDNFNRGRFAFFNVDKKKQLYLEGKKTYSYGKPRANFVARFTGAYAVDEGAYRQRKLDALKNKAVLDTPAQIMRDRNRALVGRLQSLDIPQAERVRISGLPSSTYYLRLKEYKQLESMRAKEGQINLNSKFQKRFKYSGEEMITS